MGQNASISVHGQQCFRGGTEGIDHLASGNLGSVRLHLPHKDNEVSLCMCVHNVQRNKVIHMCFCEELWHKKLRDQSLSRKMDQDVSTKCQEVKMLLFSILGLKKDSHVLFLN